MPLDGSYYSEKLPTLKRPINLIKSYFLERDVDDIYFYGKDEAKNNALKQQINITNYAHSQGIKVFVAGSSGHMDTVKGATDVLVYFDEASKEASDNAHSYGKKILQYARPQSGVENPVAFRNNYGFKLIQNGFDGAMVYAYQDSMGYMWDDYDHPYYRDHALTYPTADSVIDTIAWEGLREAIDDTRYYELLVQMIDDLGIGAVEAGEIMSKVRSAINNYLPEKARMVIIEEIKSLLKNG
jgi:hypothetical protein